MSAGPGWSPFALRSWEGLGRLRDRCSRATWDRTCSCASLVRACSRCRWSRFMGMAPRGASSVFRRKSLCGDKDCCQRAYGRPLDDPPWPKPIFRRRSSSPAFLAPRHRNGAGSRNMTTVKIDQTSGWCVSPVRDALRCRHVTGAGWFRSGLPRRTTSNQFRGVTTPGPDTVAG